MTINRLSFDETCNNSDNEFLMSGMGDTVFFHTIMASNDNDGIDEQQKTIKPLKSDDKNQLLTVYPKRLLINPFSNTSSGNKNIIVIKSNFSNAQTFELIGNFRHLFMCTPSMGTIEPGEEIQIDVKIKKTALPSDQLVMGIYIENDKFDVLIDVDKSDLPAHLRW